MFSYFLPLRTEQLQDDFDFSECAIIIGDETVETTLEGSWVPVCFVLGKGFFHLSFLSLRSRLEWTFPLGVSHEDS